MTACAARTSDFEPEALSVAALEGLSLAGFELADPFSYDPSRSTCGAILIREKGTDRTRWFGLAQLQWVQNPVEVLRSLLCAGCHRPLADDMNNYRIARGTGRHVSVRNYHAECAPVRAGTP